MNSAQPEPKNMSTRLTYLALEIGGQEEQPPLRIPVTIQNLSIGGVTLAVKNPWALPNSESYHGQDCILCLEGPEGRGHEHIKARITWSKWIGAGQPKLSMGLQLIKPSGETLQQLSGLINHTTQDIKGLWEKYDQVKATRDNSHLMAYLYKAGLALLLGGVALQVTGLPSYKLFGWGLWLLGSLGVGTKILWSIRQKQAST
jgi:hypothetical protein